MNNIKSLDEFSNILNENDAVLVYFSHEQCNVCKVLKPKVTELLDSKFPLMKMYYADTVVHPEISAQYSIFAVPTILVFFAGRESFRRSRNIGINELQELIERPYSMIFE